MKCPEILSHHFTKEYSLMQSDKCCLKMKKEPVHKWEKENNRTIAITGMRAEEGGMRTQINCILEQNGKIEKFHPLVKVDEQWENWFIEKYDIKLCKLYYPPFNFKRTGCAGCPFAIDLLEQLEIMALYLPKERQKCEIIWQPVYAEYRRLNYRLKNIEEIKLF